MEVQRVLPGEPSSAGRARRFAEQTLHHWRQDELSELLTLLVSELVTNAVLHAGSDIRVRLVLESAAVRLEVHDGSPVLPAALDYGEEASTGRGLELVSALAQSWGVEPSGLGKVVWCTLPATDVPPTAPQDRSVHEPVSDRRSEEVATSPPTVFHLTGVPLALYQAMRQHNDALLREAAFVAFREGDNPSVPEPLSTHAAVVGAAAAQVDDARAAGAATVDLTAKLPAATLAGVPALQAALEEADALARHESLLTPPALPEVRACRQWVLAELVSQHAGALPQPWRTPAALDAARDQMLAEVEHAAVLDTLSDGVIVGDESNRIAYANPAVEALLGWPAGELVGQRITVVVPERLREAHVAGYSRYLVTGEPVLIGTPVRVPARCRDGHEVPVELLLDVARVSERRRMFVASLRDMTERAHLERHTPVTAAVGALREVVASLTAQPGGLAAVADAVLETLGARLAWSFAAMWEVQGQALTCLSTWQGDPAGLVDFRTVTAQQRFVRGLGLPGRVWESGEPTWITDVVADANFPRAGAALQDGLRTAAGVPIIAWGVGVIGVIELYTRETLEIDTDLLAVLAAVGETIAALVRPNR